MKHWSTSVRALFAFTLVTGVFYPLFLTLIGYGFFPGKSRGSLVAREGRVRGSELIAQSFSQPRYFWPRPSAVKYDAASSGASNQSVASSELVKAIGDRSALGFTHEMRFASGSGLDPHISPEAAHAQVKRIAEARNFNADQRKSLQRLVDALTEERQWGFLGEPRINVLRLNLALDERY